MFRLRLLALLLPACPLSWADCGPLPNDVLAYGAAKLDVEKDVTVNGQPVPKGTSNHLIAADGSTTTSSVTIPDLDPPSFPANGSALNADEGDSPFVANSGEMQSWKKIHIAKNASAAFTGGGEFHIDELKADKNSVLNMAAGSYFVRRLSGKQKGTLNITSAPVVLHVGKEAKFDKESMINAGGNPTNLIIYLHADAKLKFGKGSRVSAVIVAPDADEAKLEKAVQFSGVLLVGGKLKLKKQVQLSLDANQLSAIGQLSTCDSTPPPANPASGLRIQHDGTGIYCLAENVTVTAVDTAGDPVTGYASSIDLDTGSGAGSWAIVAGNGSLSDPVAGDGRATYTFDPADGGSAMLALSYPEGPSVINLSAMQSDDPSITDDATHGPLVWAPTGFTVTAAEVIDPGNDAGNALGTQIAGTTFAVHLTAYGNDPEDVSCGIISSYSGSHDLLVWQDYVNPTGGTLAASIDGRPAGRAPTNGVRVNVAFIAGKAVLGARYDDAGRIAIHLRDDSGSSVLSGSTGAFVVRPADLVVTEVRDAAGSPNPGAQAGGAGFTAAGAPFRVTVEARNAQGAVTPNFGNETPAESLGVVSRALLWPAGGRNGSGGDGALAGGSFNAVVPGVFTATDVTFDEAGTIALAAEVADGDYLGSGPLSSASPVAVGRFYPSEFVVSGTDVATTCGGFAYMGEPAISASATLTARAASGTTTTNYDAALMGAGQVASVVLEAEDADNGTPLGARIDVPSVSFAAGVAQLATTTAVFNRGAVPDGPFPSLVIGVTANDDPDGIGVSGADMRADASGACMATGDCTARSLGAPLSIAYGRLEVRSAGGPETASLSAPLELRSFDGNAFRIETGDSCTTYRAAAATLTDFTGNLDSTKTTVAAPTAATPFEAGRSAAAAPLSLTAPGAGNTGTVRIVYDAPAWLEYPWPNGARDPSATLRFGAFRGHDRVIFWREVSN